MLSPGLREVDSEVTTLGFQAVAFFSATLQGNDYSLLLLIDLRVNDATEGCLSICLAVISVQLLQLPLQESGQLTL